MKIYALLGAALLLSSCATVKKLDTAKSMEIHGPGVIQYPVIADLEVQEQKVRGVATGRRSELTSVQQLARVNAMKMANADVLVAPVYEIETKRNRTTVTVTGFAANYKNFRSATVADSSLVENVYMHQPNTLKVDEPQTRKTNAAWLSALGGILVAGFLLVMLAF